MTVRGDITVERSPFMKACACQIGDGDHLADVLAALFGVVVRVFGQDDRGFCVVGQIIQGGNKAPTVHLALVDLLCAVVKACCVAQADCVGVLQTGGSICLA